MIEKVNGDGIGCADSPKSKVVREFVVYYVWACGRVRCIHSYRFVVMDDPGWFFAVCVLLRCW